VTEFLDAPLYFLANPRPAVLDLALLRTEEGSAALVFSVEGAARAHLAALPPGAAVLCADDHRAKEELFRAALARGAHEVWLDTEVDGAPRLRYPLRRALDYVLSFKRQSACL
jgi:hypothetical protein